MNVTELRGTVGKGYNLAAIVPLTERAVTERTTEDWLDFFAKNGVPVLAEASGVIGIARALALRCGPLLRDWADDRQEHRILHLQFIHADGRWRAVLNDHIFKIHHD